MEMLAGILGGMPFDDSDTVLIVDILPNRPELVARSNQMLIISPIQI